MNISLAIILGLTGAISWGAADFAARFASRHVGAYRTLFFMQFFGLLALSVYLKSTGGFSHGFAPGWQPWVMAVAAGLLNILAYQAHFTSFENGTITIAGLSSSIIPVCAQGLSLAATSLRNQNPGQQKKIRSTQTQTPPTPQLLARIYQQ